MRGEAAPYSLVPSEQSSLLEEREGEELEHVKTMFSNTDNNNTKHDNKRR